MKICIGIISCLPPETDEAKPIRKKAFTEEIKALDKTLNLPILVVAQNYTEEDKKIFSKNCLVDYYGPLGVTRARQTLRHKFLATDFDYMIIFDDDEIIVGDTIATKYLETIYNNPDKYIHYHHTFLRACAISRFILERIPFVPVNAQQLEGWDDALYIDCIKRLYPDHFMKFPEDSGFHCEIDRSNREFPSTWFQSLSAVSKQILDKNFLNKERKILNDPDFKIPDEWFDNIEKE